MRTQRVPWVTHLVAAAAVVAWSVGAEQYYYGIDTRGPLWPSVSYFPQLVVTLTLTVGLAAAVVEMLLVGIRSTLVPARVLAVLYVVVAGFVAGFPMGFRLVGDDDPAALEDVMAFVIAFPVFVLGQLLLTVLLTRLRRH
jgi:uncharacterized membrane protein YGL010W